MRRAIVNSVKFQIVLIVINKHVSTANQDFIRFQTIASAIHVQEIAPNALTIWIVSHVAKVSISRIINAFNAQKVVKFAVVNLIVIFALMALDLIRHRIFVKHVKLPIVSLAKQILISATNVIQVLFWKIQLGRSQKN